MDSIKFRGNAFVQHSLNKGSLKELGEHSNDELAHQTIALQLIPVQNLNLAMDIVKKLKDFQRQLKTDIESGNDLIDINHLLTRARVALKEEYQNSIRDLWNRKRAGRLCSLEYKNELDQEIAAELTTMTILLSCRMTIIEQLNKDVENKWGESPTDFFQYNNSKTACEQIYAAHGSSLTAPRVSDDPKFDTFYNLEWITAQFPL